MLSMKEVVGYGGVTKTRTDMDFIAVSVFIGWLTRKNTGQFQKGLLLTTYAKQERVLIPTTYSYIAWQMQLCRGVYRSLEI